MKAIATLVVLAALAAASETWAQAMAGHPAKGPIKVGAISSVALFPEAAAAVKAYFDTVNANGGVQGRELQLIVADDRADPGAAAAAARKLVDEAGVVAHVGSASALECSVNANYYAERNLVSIQGTGVDPACFTSPNIAPVNTGPYTATAVALTYLSDILRRQNVCAVTVSYVASQTAAFEQAIERWKTHSGKRLAYEAIGISPRDSLEEHIRRATESQCNGLVFTAVEPAVIDWVRTARALKVSGIDWIFLTPAYTQNVADTLGADGEGIYAMSEFEPWSSRSGMLTHWRSTISKNNVPLTSLSQGGYAAAWVFVNVLRGIRGDINRATVTSAFRSMQPQKVSLMGSSFSFGPSQHHNPNRAAIPMRIEGGKWRIAHWEFLFSPQD